MNIRILTTAAVSLVLVAAALPSVALAKDAPAGESDTKYPADVVVAQDSSKGPKVEGWQTGAGDMSDEDCQGFADQIETAVNDAIDNAESNDIDGMLANLDFADSTEDLANTMGCAINYQAKSAGDKGSFDAESIKAGTSMKIQGWQTGGGSASDEVCQGYADGVQEAIDDAQTDFEEGDPEAGENHLQLAEVIEDAALNRGCAISYGV